MSESWDTLDDVPTAVSWWFIEKLEAERRPAIGGERMRRATLILSLSVSAVALVAIVYGTSFRQPPDAGKSPLREVGQPRHAASADTQPDASTVVVTQPTENDLQKGDDHESSVVKEARRKTRGRDEATTRKWVREETTREVKEDFVLLFEHLDLTSSENEAG